ncbi:MAG: hypothetical protein K2L95_00145 [Alphaproteobacteria bacterium]|nr:hypothetical protein [Alphaproteobacteria bacterium]MDE6570619.1 hypothetical protein [Alphaproteobacteria bacterium]
MRNKFKIWGVMFLGAVFYAGGVMAAAAPSDDADMMEELSADSVAAYRVDGSLFQQITDLEQEKVLMQLEKERAQLDLELDRLAAEKIKLHMEIDTLSGRAEAQQQELETERAKLEAEAARLAREKASLEADVEAAATRAVVTSVRADLRDAEMDAPLSDSYRLINVIGAGSQLQATIEDLNTGQNKRLSVGKTLDGYIVKSISLDDGIVFVKDGVTQNLNIGSAN